MEKRTALITGGAKGIGKAIVRKLASEGFSIAINYRNSESEALALVKELQEKGVHAIAIKADVSSYDEVLRLYDECKKNFGFIDTLVNNAGVCKSMPLIDCSCADYDYIMNNNLKSVFNTCRIFSPDMVSERFGRIVNISSVWGERGASTEVLYSASKAGVIGFTKALNAELAINGVTVNAVTPGIIDTDMNAHLTESEIADFVSGVSLERVGQAEEVADAVSLLVKEKSYIAGAVIAVNGGLL